MTTYLGTPKTVYYGGDHHLENYLPSPIHTLDFHYLAIFNGAIERDWARLNMYKRCTGSRVTCHLDAIYSTTRQQTLDTCLLYQAIHEGRSALQLAFSSPLLTLS